MHWKELLREQRGAFQLITLLVLTMGVLFVVPFVASASTYLRSSSTHEQLLIDEYTAQGGVEYAIWRLLYESGFANTLTEQSPEASFFNPTPLNNMPAFITVRRQFPSPPQAAPSDEEPIPGVVVSAVVSPKDAPAGVETIFTYTIYIQNLRTDTLQMSRVSDFLPASFHYRPGSSSGITTNDPNILITGPQSEEELRWSFSQPRPSIVPLQTLSQTFQATATLVEGTYWNSALVQFQQSSPNKAFSGPTSPVLVSAIYDIRVGTITATIKIVDGNVIILSWQVE
jgi:uncharacterized repeat protein (TIGR01451 family)